MPSKNTHDPLHDPLLEAQNLLPGPLKRFFARLDSKPRPLQHIQVEVTSFCPGACAYCPRGILHSAWQARHMQDKVFAALTPLMLRSRRVHLQGWGEPFAHPRFTDYVHLARKAGCAVSTTTCGLVMNKALARRVVESGMDIVAFSLVGTDEKSNGARKNVPLAGVERAVRLLQKAKKDMGSALPHIHFSYLLLADRLEATLALPGLMESWDIAECVVSTLDMPVLPEHWEWAYKPNENDKIARARDVLERVSADVAEKGRSLRFCLPGKKTGICREDVDKSCYVDAEGYLSPCIYLNVPFREEMFKQKTLLEQKRLVYGNILDTDPVRIWDMLDYRDFRADLAHGATPPTCLTCPKRYEHMF